MYGCYWLRLPNSWFKHTQSCFMLQGRTFIVMVVHTTHYSMVIQKLTPHISAVIHHGAVHTSLYCTPPSAQRRMMDGCYKPT